MPDAQSDRGAVGAPPDLLCAAGAVRPAPWHTGQVIATTPSPT
jgi:hypothetical protein